MNYYEYVNCGVLCDGYIVSICCDVVNFWSIYGGLLVVW